MTAPTKPSPLYNWDTAGTNVIAPTSGHQTSGFATDEVPASSEFNGLWANWGDELAWLDYEVSAILAETTKQTAPLNYITISGTVTYTGGAKRYLSSSGSWAIRFGLPPVPNGYTLTEVTLYYSNNSGGVICVLDAPGGNGATGGIANFTDSSATGDKSQNMSTATFTSLPWASDGTKGLEFNLTLGAGDKIYGATMTYQPT
ncbi:MAG TPA: hypothetical protein VGL61_06545 [Kofleriaceae bacterium]|jgi:hypothetical protein